MSALRYLIVTGFKNRLREMVKKPSRIVYAVLMLAVLILMLVSGSHTGEREYSDIAGLVAIASGFYTAMFLMTVNAGFSRGGNLFNLSDVSLLFTAPIRPQTVLFYGLFRQMGMSLFVGFILLFQYANLHNIFGITISQMVALLLFYAAAQFSAQVAAMLLYAYCCNHPRRKRVCRTVMAGIYALCAFWIILKGLDGPLDSLADRALAAVNGPVLCLAPVGGWLGLAAKGVLLGEAAPVLIGLALCAALVGLMVAALFHMDPDFYEDVLKSAEISYSAISAKKEGTMQEALPDRIKVGKQGLGRGWGASTFFRKHLVEDRRCKKLPLTATGLIFGGIAIVFALFTADEGPLPTLIMATYFQMFSAMTTGRFNYELLRPYLYLVPEPALKKLLWALAQTVPAMAVDALVVFIPVGLILRLTLPEILVLLLARMSFGVVYLAADIAVERIWGGNAAKMLVMLMYLAIALVIMAPGAVLAIVSAAGGGLGMSGALLVDSGINLTMSLLVFFLCRNLLEYAELSGQ